MTTYRNPWHKAGGDYGPSFYETEVTPREYRGYLIYNRIDGYGVSGRGVWDVVKNGVCVAQHAGPRGARERIDSMVQS